LVIASGTSSFDNKQTINALGLTFETEEGEEIEVLESSLDGIFSFSPNKGFVMLDDKFKEYSYGGGNTKNEKQETITEYCARTEIEFSNNNYQERLKEIDDKYYEVVKKVGNDYTTENLQLLDQAEIEHDIAVESLEDECLGISNKQLMTI
jgi:hypothetical protein